MSQRAAIGWAAVGAGASAAIMLLVMPSPRPVGAPERGLAVTQDTTRPTQSDRDGDVRIAKGEQRRIGLTLATVKSTSAPAITHGFARGLDTGALAAIDAEIITARSAASASQAEAARLALLASQDQSASVKSVQAARAQAAADAARANLAAQRIGLEYGAGLARIGARERGALIVDVAAGRSALVRVDVPGASLADLRRVLVDGGGGSLRVIGPAAAADVRLQSAGVLAVLRGPLAGSATNGRVFGVTIERGNAESGVVVPRDAVLRWRGGLWVYRQQGSEAFSRTELIGARSTADGWFVASGLPAGSRVAVSAAGTLLAIDRGGGSAPDED